ncbi:MAG: hypothetical protein R6U39_11480 [Candidatus Aegiribacteria sp.]
MTISAEGESRGRLEIDGDDCHVILHRAVVRFTGGILAAEELLE